MKYCAIDPNKYMISILLSKRSIWEFFCEIHCKEPRNTKWLSTTSSYQILLFLFILQKALLYIKRIGKKETNTHICRKKVQGTNTKQGCFTKFFLLIHKALCRLKSNNSDTVKVPFRTCSSFVHIFVAEILLRSVCCKHVIP